MISTKGELGLMTELKAHFWIITPRLNRTAQHDGQQRKWTGETNALIHLQLV
jgi:hypothetical protein